MGTTAARMGQILNMLSDYLSRGFVLQKAKLPLTVHFYIKTTVLASQCSTERSLLNKIFGESLCTDTKSSNLLCSLHRKSQVEAPFQEGIFNRADLEQSQNSGLFSENKCCFLLFPFISEVRVAGKGWRTSTI